LAIWQFDVRVIPRKVIAGLKEDLPLAISEDDYLEGHTWRAHDHLADLPITLSELLPPRDTWSDDLKSWGEEDGDRVDLYHSGGEPDEWYVRFDMRSPNHVFIAKIVELIARYDGVIVTSAKYVVPPSYIKLLSHMQRSDSFRCVEDPEKFFAELSSRNTNEVENGSESD